MGDETLDIDVAIVGGGCAGLWSLNVLRRAGYSVALFESDALGSEQTVHSQGIIHSGLKYALTGNAGADATALAGMPRAWRDCLAGDGSVDLRDCRVASEHVLLWSGSDLPSRVTSMLAGRLLRTRSTRLSPPDYPPPFDTPAFRGQLYLLEDFALDTTSLLNSLARPHADAIFHSGHAGAALTVERGQAQLVLPGVAVRPRRLLLCAGAGNAALLRQLGAGAPAMQRRPLTQVAVSHERLPPLFAHCVGRGASPRLTVSTHYTASGAPLWYLGGDLATAPALTEAERLALARRELRETLPWLDLEGAQWRALTLDRAEPARADHRKPDGAFLSQAAGVANALVAWPVKLTLCPALGEQVLQQLRRTGVEPGNAVDLSPLATLARPTVATPRWKGPGQ